jgi:cytoskeletal protein CcmA (bactofilin family)
MGFFKEFKDDLSKAVNELLPDGGANQEEAEEIVNTLDTEEAVAVDESETEKMKEWLEDFAQTEETGEESAEVELKEDDFIDTVSEQQEDKELFDDKVLDEKEIEKKEEAEGENMDDNVDLELLSALNAEEEADRSEKMMEKPQAKLKAASVVADDDEVTVITKGTTINGSISSDGSLDVKGNITGDIECLGKLSITGKIVGNSSASEIYVNTERLEGSITSEGSVKVGLGTVIIGDIIATSGVIAGAIKGEIDINGPIVIDSTAIIKGNIKAKSVQINNGAVIEGFCSLSYAAVDVDNIFE